MPSPLNLVIAGALAACLSACTKVSLNGSQPFIVHPGQNITTVVNARFDYSEFLLEAGTYTAYGGKAIFRNHIIIRKKDPASTVRVTDPIQLSGDNNIIDGLTWDADLDPNLRESDPGTLAISGRNNLISRCIFRNMRTTGGHGSCIISIGRLEENGHFINTVANNNVIDSCTFYNWGLRGEAKGSTKSSTCIAVGEENDKGKFTGTVIRRNSFTEGPYQEYGYNAAIKVFNSSTLENNYLYKGQECLEIKFGNSTIKGNTIHHFSGYNILANRLGRNNLYENNIVYDVKPIDKTSSAQGIMIWEAGNTVYRNNLVYDCARAVLVLGKQTSGNALMQYVLLENNSFIRNNVGITFNNLAGSPRNVILVKNIFYSDPASPRMHMLSGFDPASIENYSDNIYSSNILADDSSSVMADPEFADASTNDYALQSSSPACGYGAIPCMSLTAARLVAPGNDQSANIVVYPTLNKFIFHVGLVGLDLIPRELEIDAANGKILFRRNYPDGSPTDLKVIDNIDLTGQPAATYTLKITTSNGVITRQITIR
jgi:hypothetical protein